MARRAVLAVVRLLGSWLVLCMLLALLPPLVVGAAVPAGEEAAPWGGGWFGGVVFVFARRGVGAVWVRQTDGAWYGGWSPLGGATDAPPAAASNGRTLAVFIRDAAGQLWVRRSLDGRVFDPWQPLGETAAAPVAVGAGGVISVFTLDGEGMLAVRSSVDGGEFGAPVSLGGPLAAVPVAVAEDERPVVIGTGMDGRRYRLEGGATWGVWRPLGGAGAPLAAQRDLLTPPIALDLGVNFISAHNWTGYQLPAYARLRPGLAKFTMFYDAYPTTPVFGAAEIDDAIALGARTIILRTAETRIAPDEVEAQLRAPLPGDGRSLLDYIGDQQERGTGVEFWIEVGNEPDLAGVSPLVARYALLATIRDVAPRYRAALPNLRWMASLPTREGLPKSTLPDYRGLAYLDLLLSDQGDGLGAVAERYDALGVHLYGADTLQQSYPMLHAPSDVFDCAGSNGDAFCPLAVLDRVLAHTDRPVFVTEAGINSALSWEVKAKFYVEALRRLPARVRGVALFTLSLDPEWYAGESDRCTKFDLLPCSRYALDVDESGRLDPNFAGATGIGQCYRLTPEQAAGLSSCGPPCALGGGSPAPVRPRSAVQRLPCQVGADGPSEPRPDPARRELAVRLAVSPRRRGRRVGWSDSRIVG
ncbi:MAG: hypothetical protein U0232_13240 [Thermomicrobiales bacterium]